MNTLFDQLKQRIDHDKKAVKDNEQFLGSVISGQKPVDPESLPSDEILKQIGQIVLFFRLQVPDPDSFVPGRNMDETIERVLRPSGASKRRVRLEDTWWKDCDGPLLVKYRDEDRVLALFPSAVQGYYYRDLQTGKKVKITKENSRLFDEQAWCFYRPLPQKPLSGKEFLLFLIRQIRTADVLLYVLTSVFLAVIGMLSPIATNIAFSQIIPTEKTPLLLSLFIMLVAAAAGGYLMRSVRFSINLRIQTRLDLVAENSLYSRVLNLPSAFFKNQTAGGLARRISSLNKFPKIIGDILMILTSVLISFVSAIPIFSIAPQLTAPAVLTLLIMLALFIVSVFQEKKLFGQELSGEEENSGLVFGLISGVQRIRLSGSENRAYAKWLRVYARKAGASYAVRFPLCVRTELITILKFAGLLWAFLISYNCQLSVAQLASFSSAYGIAIGCMANIANHGRNLSRIKPILEMGKPILQAVPEPSVNRKEFSHLQGKISLNHVSFRYAPDDPAVLNNLSLDIRPGEYVAIVGKSGCGKSTLVKLLLGFETPERGSILYDDTDINEIDMRSLRKCIGTVLQDGKLFSGDILSNITITAPWLGPDEAWDAAEKTGIAEDIRKMPQGMHTIISEGSGGLSGGQKQRLMIARAIVSNPGVLILDEATSALDNLTQKIVTDSMNAMHCTRIVIAHRLSTIHDCDRILVLDKGKIIESGTYDSLMAQNGFFAELVARQQI